MCNVETYLIWTQRLPASYVLIIILNYSYMKQAKNGQHRLPQSHSTDLLMTEDWNTNGYVQLKNFPILFCKFVIFTLFILIWFWYDMLWIKSRLYRGLSVISTMKTETQKTDVCLLQLILSVYIHSTASMCTESYGYSSATISTEIVASKKFHTF